MIKDVLVAVILLVLMISAFNRTGKCLA